jgi:pantetheine-phosphate adenylyltransferase
MEHAFAIYPGTFSPWHTGHTDILIKALKVFPSVRVVLMKNPTKDETPKPLEIHETLRYELVHSDMASRVSVDVWDGTLPQYVKERSGCVGVIRGLRDYSDLQYEQNLQYWYEDLGLKIPIAYFVCDRKLSHISSSAIRALSVFKAAKNEDQNLE